MKNQITLQNSKVCNMLTMTILFGGWLTLSLIKTYPAKLGKGGLISDYWFTPNLNVVKWEGKKPLLEQKSQLSGPTLLSKLENLGFAGFFLPGNIFMGFNLTEMTSRDIKLKDCKKIETAQLCTLIIIKYIYFNSFSNSWCVWIKQNHQINL